MFTSVQYKYHVVKCILNIVIIFIYFLMACMLTGSTVHNRFICLVVEYPSKLWQLHQWNILKAVDQTLENIWDGTIHNGLDDLLYSLVPARETHKGFRNADLCVKEIVFLNPLPTFQNVFSLGLIYFKIMGHSLIWQLFPLCYLTPVVNLNSYVPTFSLLQSIFLFVWQIFFIYTLFFFTHKNVSCIQLPSQVQLVFTNYNLAKDHHFPFENLAS